MQELSSFFNIIILIMSIVIHEVSHGFAAYFLGDDTAKRQGRLTLNPIHHLDLFGSIIIPLIFIFSGTGYMFGWAKPVPFNPNNLRNRKWGTIIVASAGIFANLIIAVIFGIGIRFALHFDVGSPALLTISSVIVVINLALFVFNLVPIPPLDGSRILFSLLPRSAQAFADFVEQYAIFILLGFIFFGWSYITPAISFLFSLFTGISIGV